MRPIFMPKTLEGLWQALAESPEARVFAGGTDLLVWLRTRRIDPPALICLERIEALRGVDQNGGEVRIGACTPHDELLQSPLIQELFPVLARAVRGLGSPQIRRMGTIGGNLVTASPAGDTLPPLFVLGAEVELQSARSTRRMPIKDFVRGPGQTALGRHEILSRVFVPVPEAPFRHHYEKVGLRSAMACAVASLAALLEVSASGQIRAVRLAWGSVGPTVVQAPEVEDALIGKPLAAETLKAAIPLVRQAVSPIDDVRAAARYRRTVAGNLLLRLLEAVHG